MIRGRAERSPPTPCGSNFMRSPTISAILADAGDARADQGLVTDKLEGQADQDRRESRELLCRLPDGRGRHRTANVLGDFAAHRGTAAAASVCVGVRRSMVMRSRQPTGGERPNARENAPIIPPPPFGPPGVAAVVRAASLACQNAVKAQKFVPVQKHPRNPGVNVPAFVGPNSFALNAIGVFTDRS
jgi:hypothetical protein